MNILRLTQTQTGKAFEYATAITIYNFYKEIGDTEIVRDSSYVVASEIFNNIIPKESREEYLKAAYEGVKKVFELEPFLTGNTDFLEIRIAEDGLGISGDVRDVILRKESIDWEIGISCKHNHEALKHQRLSKNIDFGNAWAGYPVSQKYWEETEPIFSKLADFRPQRVKWSELNTDNFSKINDVYIPLLNAFLEELNLLDSQYSDLAPKFMEYLAGRKDFYKFVMKKTTHKIEVYTYNLHGCLNRGGSEIQQIFLPTKFISKKWKLNRNGTLSNNTLIIEMDNEWIISLRLHSASSMVETSLKFDSMPIKLPDALRKFILSY